MKKNGMRVTSLFLAAVMLASAPVTACAADTSANVEGEVVVDQTSQDQTSAESQNQAGQDQTSAEAQDQSQASAAENAATGANSDNVTIQADDKPYLALGADLTDAQKNTVLSLMGIDPANLGNYDVVYTTNAEEHQYLDSYISSSQIGSKSWSSVVIVKRDKGNGLNISTRNINYCTVGMYKNALTTAGITDADIIVAGPQEISGTAALVGVFKAYQEMTGETINADIIDASLNELVVTGQLEQSIAGLSDEEVEWVNGILSVELNELLGDDANDDLLEFGKGSYHLDGKQALAYSRIRKVPTVVDGIPYADDFGRAQRQRVVMTQVMQNVLKNPTRLGAVLTSALPNVCTNMHTGGLYWLSLKAPFMLLTYDKTQQQIPYQDETQSTFQGSNIDGQDVLEITDFAANQQRLKETIYGK